MRLLNALFWGVFLSPMLATSLLAQFFYTDGSIGRLELTSDTALYASRALDNSLDVEVELTFTRKSGAILGTNTFSLRLELVNADDQVVQEQVELIGARNTESLVPEVFNYHIVPSQQLDVNDRYFVRAQLLRGGLTELSHLSVGAPLSTSARQYYHFVNTQSVDEPFNVLFEFEEVEWQRLFAIRTSETQQTFQVDAIGNVYRYDQYEGSVGSDTVEFVFTYQLVDASTGLVVSTVETESRHTLPLARFYEHGGQRYPSTLLNQAFTIDVEPVEQLNPVSGQYYLRVLGAHVEVPAAAPTVAAEWTAPAQRLLHFSGALDFGGVPTTFTAVSNTPTHAPGGVNYINTSLQVSDGSGLVESWDTLTFGQDELLSEVRLMADGAAAVQTGEAALVVSAGTELSELLRTAGDIAYYYNTLKLTPDGPVAGETVAGGAETALTLLFPSGSGYTTDSVLLNQARLVDLVALDGPVALDANFSPQNAVSKVVSSKAWFYQEGRPYGVEFDQLSFSPDSGLISLNAVGVVYNHGAALDALEAQVASLESVEMAVKPSNEQYYRFITSVSGTVSVQADFEGRALVTSSVNLGAGQFTPHFPLCGEIAWTGNGKVNQIDNVIQADSVLSQVQAIKLSYHQSCADAFCELGAPPVEALTWTADGGLLLLTPDGGLFGSGAIVKEGLDWGYLETTAAGQALYAHRTGGMQSGHFLVAGHALLGGAATWNSAAVTSDYAFEHSPSVLLLSGFDATLRTHERFGTAAYMAGLADYAGLNFRLDDFADLEAYSRLGRPDPALADFAFTPDAISKYYVRLSGVSGIHEAAADSFDPKMSIYGYSFNLDNYGLSFLDSENHESQINGSLEVPEPSNFSQAFKALTVSCVGELEEAQLDPADLGDKRLSYWNGVIQPKTMRFLAPTGDSPCNRTGDPALALGVITAVAHIDTLLFAEMGFLADGQIVAPADGYPLTSRFQLPAQVELAGPSAEDPYTLTAVNALYFNDAAEGPAERGFATFAATQDVPFFVDIPVQVMTSADPESSAPFDVVGGWPDKGWSVGDANFFTQADFDPDNIAWPSADVADYDDYRRPSSAAPTAYTPVAQQSFFGVIDFDYPLKWNTSARYYRSYQSVNTDLMVLNLDHAVDYLSAEFIEVSFGAQYDGMPQLNLSNILFTAAEDRLGAGQAFVEGIQAEAFTALKGGIDGTAAMLNDKIDELYAEFFSLLDAAVLDPLYDELGAEFSAALDAVQNQGPDLFRDYRAAYAEPLLDEYLYDPLDPDGALLFIEIDKLRGTLNEPFGLVREVDARLVQLDQALVAIAGKLYVTQQGIEVELPAVEVEKIVPGLLTKNAEGQRNVISNLIVALVADFVEDPLGSMLTEQLTEAINGAENEIQQQLDALLAEAEPTIAEIERMVADLREQVAALRAELAVAGEIQAAINAVMDEAESEIQQIASEVRDEADQLLDRLEAEYDSLYPTEQLQQIRNPFEEYPREEVTALLRQKLVDEVGASQMVKRIQYTLKQYLYDLNNTVELTVENAFAEVNQMVKELIAETVVELEKEINPMLADLSDAVGAGQIDGVARFRGDALVRLRLDGQFEWQVPESLQFRGYLEYLQHDSDGPGSCGGASGAKLTEVSMGALDVPLDWISPDMRADVGAKFSMVYDAGNALLPVTPVGLGGSFQMTGGELSYESFTIFDLKAAAGFGKFENYIAASAGMIISNYEASGGIFFGRTCSPDPILLVDPLAGEIIGDGSFTGAYAYGEAWIPVSEAALGIPASCMFRVSAGVGAGIFYFLEGPVYGGRMLAGASGEALCAVSIRGDVNMVGVKDGGEFRFNGQGRLKGKAGPCPFCLKFSKTAKVKYDGKWSIDL